MLQTAPKAPPRRPKTAPRPTPDSPKTATKSIKTAPRSPSLTRDLPEPPRDAPGIPPGPPVAPPGTLREPPGTHPGHPNSKMLGPFRCDSGMSNKQTSIQANMQTASSTKGRRVPRRASNFHIHLHLPESILSMDKS